MKKTLFLLLCTVQFYGQTSTGQEQSFPYGIVNESLQTITTPTYIGTFGTDGTQGKIPSAYIAKTSDVADSLATKENVANKSDSYTTSSSIAYVSGKALVEGLRTKQNTLTNPVTGTFVAGRVPYTSSTTSLVDSSRLLWDNTNSYLEVNGNSPRFTLKNNLNNYSTYFTNNAGGALFLKNQQDKTLAIFNNPVTSTDQPKLAIGQVTSIPTESQLYVYGGENGANIDARGSATVDEANIDLEGNDWVTNPNSIGLSYFGSNATSFGTVMGYSKNKLGQIRFQDNTVSAITSNKVSGVSPIRFGINDVQIANVSNTGISYQSDFSSINSSNPRWLADKSYVDAGLAAKQNTLTNPITGTGTNGHISFWNGANTQTGDSGLIWDNTNKRLGIGTTNPLQKFVVSDTGANGIEIAIAAVPSVGGTIQSYDRASFVYRPLEYSSSKHFFNNGNVLIATGTDNGVDKLQVNGTISASAATTANQVVVKSQLDAAVPYKKYVALISQTGTSAPTATVLENTLGGTITWTRSNTGQYVGTLTGAFTDQKTIIFVNRSNPAATAFDTNMAANVININTVGYTTFSNSAYVDGQTNSASIEIRVYN